MKNTTQETARTSVLNNNKSHVDIKFQTKSSHQKLIQRAKNIKIEVPTYINRAI